MTTTRLPVAAAGTEGPDEGMEPSPKRLRTDCVTHCEGAQPRLDTVPLKTVTINGLPEQPAATFQADPAPANLTNDTVPAQASGGRDLPNSHGTTQGPRMNAMAVALVEAQDRTLQVLLRDKWNVCNANEKPSSNPQHSPVQHSQGAGPPVADVTSRINGHANCSMLLDATSQQQPVCASQGAEGTTADESTLIPDDVTQHMKKPVRAFWQAGDVDPWEQHDAGDPGGPGSGFHVHRSLDACRLHPKFLHTNATSHKWALGALAELLDNSYDEIHTGATFVKVDRLDMPARQGQAPAPDQRRAMLCVEDDGGGMDPDRIRQCMSFGYSVKGSCSKMIGQYGNGFKTSSMRLGGDVLVLTRSQLPRPSASVGLLSYTFLRATRSQTVVVPIIDFDTSTTPWTPILPSAAPGASGGAVADDWSASLRVLLEWGPYSSHEEVVEQLASLGEHGTRVLMFNLWETEDGHTELDFDSDPHDIKLWGSGTTLGGAAQQESKSKQQQHAESSAHYRAWRSSLVSYASLLYLQLPQGFRIIVRGRDVPPNPLRGWMKHVRETEYKPKGHLSDEGGKDGAGHVAPVLMGFAKEAPSVNVSGFCVYHKNRLIKPFWQVYTSNSSVGRGVIGHVQVDFIAPAHDKQDFERTLALERLEDYLKRQVKEYWNANAFKVGYQASQGGGSGVRRRAPPAPAPAPSAPSAAAETATAAAVSAQATTVRASASERPSASGDDSRTPNHRPPDGLRSRSASANGSGQEAPAAAVKDAPDIDTGSVQMVQKLQQELCRMIDAVKFLYRLAAMRGATALDLPAWLQHQIIRMGLPQLPSPSVAASPAQGIRHPAAPPPPPAPAGPAVPSRPPSQQAPSPGHPMHYAHHPQPHYHPHPQHPQMQAPRPSPAAAMVPGAAPGGGAPRPLPPVPMPRPRAFSTPVPMPRPMPAGAPCSQATQQPIACSVQPTQMRILVPSAAPAAAASTIHVLPSPVAHHHAPPHRVNIVPGIQPMSHGTVSTQPTAQQQVQVGRPSQASCSSSAVADAGPVILPGLPIILPHEEPARLPLPAEQQPGGISGSQTTALPGAAFISTQQHHASHQQGQLSQAQPRPSTTSCPVQVGASGVSSASQQQQQQQGGEDARHGALLYQLLKAVEASEELSQQSRAQVNQLLAMDLTSAGCRQHVIQEVKRLCCVHGLDTAKLSQQAQNQLSRIGVLSSQQDTRLQPHHPAHQAMATLCTPGTSVIKVEPC